MFSFEAIAPQADGLSASDTKDNFLQIGVLKCEIDGIFKKLQHHLVVTSASEILSFPAICLKIHKICQVTRILTNIHEILSFSSFLKISRIFAHFSRFELKSLKSAHFTGINNILHFLDLRHIFPPSLRNRGRCCTNKAKVFSVREKLAVSQFITFSLFSRSCQSR